MKVIWKYEITENSKISIEMPKDAEILDVQVQDSVPCIWALVEPKAEPISRMFEIFGTGHTMQDVPYKRKYIGTFQLSGDRLVYHLFEIVSN